MQQIFRRTPMRVFSCKFATCFQNNFLRRNFSLVARYSLKFTRCSLFVVKSLLFIAKFACYSLQKLLVAKNHSLLVAEVARCKNQSLLVAKFTRYSLHKLLVAKNHSLLIAKFARYLLQKFTRRSL